MGIQINGSNDSITAVDGSLSLSGAELASVSGINVSGVVTATSFQGNGSALTGVASTDNIRTNTNATFLQNVNITGAGLTVGVTTITSSSLAVNGINYPAAGPLSNRNLIINGAMAVAQRDTSSTTSGYYTVDRFLNDHGGGGAITQSQVALTSGSPYDEGFRYFYRQTNSTASTAAGRYMRVLQLIEAQNMAQSGWNYTSSSSYVTLSFWVRSSVAQEFYGVLNTKDGTSRNYPFSTGTLVADTWTKVTKTIPGDSNITINNDTGIGLQVEIIPFYGTNFTDSGVTVDAWANYAGGTRVPDMTSTWAGTTNATFDITGVQLEVGSVATPFEHRGYGDELTRCQRYYYKIQPSVGSHSFGLGFNRSSTLCQAYIKFPVTMRANPSAIETSGTASDYQVFYLTTAAECDIVPFLDYANTEGSDFYFRVASGLTAGQGSKAVTKTTNAYLAWSAEL